MALDRQAEQDFAELVESNAGQIHARETGEVSVEKKTMWQLANDIVDAHLLTRYTSQSEGVETADQHFYWLINWATEVGLTQRWVREKRARRTDEVYQKYRIGSPHRRNTPKLETHI